MLEIFQVWGYLVKFLFLIKHARWYIHIHTHSYTYIWVCVCIYTYKYVYMRSFERLRKFLISLDPREPRKCCIMQSAPISSSSRHTDILKHALCRWAERRARGCPGPCWMWRLSFRINLLWHSRCIAFTERNGNRLAVVSLPEGARPQRRRSPLFAFTLLSKSIVPAENNGLQGSQFARWKHFL